VTPNTVLFVCSSNICRSPLAETVFRQRAARSRIPGLIVDSAGTHGGHAGERPDSRACAVAARRGYKVPPRRARRIESRDFARFHWIFAMDRRNLADLTAQIPAGFAGRMSLLLDLVPACGAQEVDDPYYGPLAGFDRVLDLCEAASDALIATLEQRHA